MAGGGVLILVAVIIVTLVLIYHYSYSGFCIFGTCDSEIKITSTEHPKLISPGERFPVKFTISNLGISDGENCVLHFSTSSRIIDEVLSEPFSIESGKQLEIELVSPSHTRSNAGELTEFEKEHTMTAYTVCDGVQSQRFNFKTTLDVKSITEKIEDVFTP